MSTSAPLTPVSPDTTRSPAHPCNRGPTGTNRNRPGRAKLSRDQLRPTETD